MPSSLWTAAIDPVGINVFSSHGPCDYSTHLCNAYFIMVLCIQGLQSSLWTAAVDPIGIHISSLRVSFFSNSLFCLIFSAI